MITTDIAIIGAGMAGASLAAMIAPHADVLVIEAEAQPGYHSTGRSAAFWSETYGGPDVQPLTSASFAFLDQPPADIAERGFLRHRGALHIADAGGEVALAAMLRAFDGSAIQLEPVMRDRLTTAIPGLKPGWERGIAEPGCRDIDVAELHAAFLRFARRNGARLLTDARVVAAARADGRWQLELTGQAAVSADVLVNAAGAWASEIAALAGAAPVAITPMRRTMVQLAIDPPASPDLPLVMDAAGHFYFKPEAGGRLWLSPHDETAVAPGDTAPEELDIAIAIDRLHNVVDWRVLRVERAWAGLRSFARDRAPVYGFDPVRPGFFWCAGQGGFGIQTAPAAAMLAAALLLDRPVPPMLDRIDPDRYRPGRFAQAP